MTRLTRRHLIGAAGLLAAAPGLTLAQNSAQANSQGASPAPASSGADRARASATSRMPSSKRCSSAVTTPAAGVRTTSSAR
jgi:hypothetical protein